MQFSNFVNNLNEVKSEIIARTFNRFNTISNSILGKFKGEPKVCFTPSWKFPLIIVYFSKKLL